jgi:enoyl-CoA hydratase
MEEMDYNILRMNFADGIAVITITRPDVLNALNSDVFAVLNDILDQLGKQRELKVIVITGEGKGFVAGADIAEMTDMTNNQAYCFSKVGKKTFERLEKIEVPVIAAVNGFALGGGCELAIACDFRIAAKSARFGQPEMNLGLIPGYGGTQRLSRLIGLGNALYMILTGDMIAAEDAFKMGLVQKVVDDDKLMEEVMKMAKKIASNGSPAVNKAKAIIRKGIEKDFNSACKMETEAFAKLFDYPSSKEGMKAFLEKRKPNW